MSMEQWLQSHEVEQLAGKVTPPKVQWVDGPVKANHDQPAPTPNEKPAMWHVVIMDMLNRDHVGRERYKTPLQPHNGRDALSDAYQEALDLAVYLRQAIFERDGK